MEKISGLKQLSWVFPGCCFCPLCSAFSRVLDVTKQGHDSFVDVLCVLRRSGANGCIPHAENVGTMWKLWVCCFCCLLAGRSGRGSPSSLEAARLPRHFPLSGAWRGCSEAGWFVHTKQGWNTIEGFWLFLKHVLVPFSGCRPLVCQRHLLLRFFSFLFFYEIPPFQVVISVRLSPMTDTVQG